MDNPAESDVNQDELIKNYSDDELNLYLNVQYNLMVMMSKQPAIKILVKSAGYLDVILNVIPALLIFLRKTPEGISILKALKLHDKITTLIS